jgi:hypothetical protein
MLANGLPEFANARLLSLQFEMRDPLSEDQRRAGTHYRIRDASAICSRAESDPLLHDAPPHDAPQHVRIRFGGPQLCGSVRGTNRSTGVVFRARPVPGGAHVVRKAGPAAGLPVPSASAHAAPRRRPLAPRGGPRPDPIEIRAIRANPERLAAASSVSCSPPLFEQSRRQRPIKEQPAALRSRLWSVFAYSIRT